jgi:hypothetical protein
MDHQGRSFWSHSLSQTKAHMRNSIQFLFGLVWLLVLFSSQSYAQLLKRSVTIPVTGVEQATLELTYSASVYLDANENRLFYPVGVSIGLNQGFGQLLRYRLNDDSFPDGVTIGPNSLIYTNASSWYTWDRRIHSYSWQVRFPGNQIFVDSGSDEFPGQTNILIGFVRQHPVGAGNQYGWVRLTRETADPRNVFREDWSERQVTFMPSGFAVHPIPEQPIRAGEPPELPQLVSEVLPAQEGLPTRVRVSWASGWSSMQLESAVELGNPVQWSPVFGLNGTEAVFDLPEDGQLYLRLAYAP